MFQSEEQARKFVRSQLEKLKRQPQITDQQIDAVGTLLEQVKETKKETLIKLAIEIDPRFEKFRKTAQPNLKANDQIFLTVQPVESKFKNLDLNATQSAKQALKVTRGSQISPTALQNSVLGLMIDGYSTSGNNKRMFSYTYSNGNPGCIVVHLKTKIPDNFVHVEDDAEPHPIRSVIMDQTRKHLTSDGQQQVTDALPLTLSVFETQKQPRRIDDAPICFPTVVSKNFFKNFIRPSKTINRQSEFDFTLQKCEFTSQNYHFTPQVVDVSSFSGQIISLDCEMVQTGQRDDLSLARTTVVDENGEVLFDEFCKPELAIVDHLTRFSGIQPGQLDDKQNQKQLIDKFKQQFLSNEKRPIICGHGLDNDFKVMGIEHSLVIDTAALFSGNNFKYKLKYLAEILLDIQIQCDEGGHDSAEDARAVMSIVRGAFKAWGSEGLLKKYENDEETAKRIIQRFKGGGEPLIDRLRGAQLKCWYNFTWMIQNGLDKIDGFSETLGEKLKDERRGRTLIVAEDKTDDIEQYLDELRVLAPGMVLIAVLDDEEREVACSWLL